MMATSESDAWRGAKRCTAMMESINNKYNLSAVTNRGLSQNPWPPGGCHKNLGLQGSVTQSVMTNVLRND